MRHECQPVLWIGIASESEVEAGRLWHHVLEVERVGSFMAFEPQGSVPVLYNGGCGENNC